MNITVVGGAGRTGSLIVGGIRAATHNPVILTRRLGGQEDAVQGSVTDPAAVVAAVRDAKAVIVVVESDDSGDGPNGPRRVHTDGIVNVLAAAPAASRIVLVSQIYITRPERLPAMREVIEARRAGEELLRRSTRPYTIVRPGWLTQSPHGVGVRLEQGDTGEGSVSRSTLAAACVAAALRPTHDRVTFEIFDAPGTGASAWEPLFAALQSDSPALADAPFSSGRA